MSTLRISAALWLTAVTLLVSSCQKDEEEIQPEADFTVTYEAGLSSIAVHVVSTETGKLSEQGLLWGDTPGLSIQSSQKEMGSLGNSYDVTLTGLTPGKVYYIKPYAILSGREFTGTETAITLDKPTYATVAPITAGRGQRVKVTGTFFTNDVKNVSVFLGGLAATVVSISPTELEFLVPEDAAFDAELGIAATFSGYDLGVKERITISRWSVLQNTQSYFNGAFSSRIWGDFFLKGAAYRFAPPGVILRYTPENDTWESLSETYDFPVKGSTLHEPVYFTINEKGYMGITQKQTDGTPVQGLYAFDPNRGSWTQKADFPGPLHTLFNSGGFVTSGSKAYFVATGNDADFWEYDATADAWTKLADFPGAPTRSLSAFALNDYVFFGIGFHQNTFTQDFYAYSIVDHTWAQVASFPEALTGSSDIRPAFSMGQRGYLIAGNKIWIYDFESNSWSLHNETIPGPEGRRRQAVFVHDDYILTGAGIYDDKANGTLNTLTDFYRWYPPEE